MRGRRPTGLDQGNRLPRRSGNPNAQQESAAHLNQIAVVKLDLTDGVSAHPNRSVRDQPRPLRVEVDAGVIPPDSALREGKIRPRPASDA